MTSPAGTPRIAPAEAGDDEDLRARLAKMPQGPGGRPVNVFATLAHRPRLAGRVNAVGGALMFDSVIGDRERELVILRTAGHVGCDYEIASHRRLGAAGGLTDAEMDAAVDPGSTHDWSPADATLLAVADEVSRSADVSDGTWAALDGVLDDGGRIELLTLIGFYRMLAGVLNGARVQIDEVALGADGRVAKA